MQVLTPLLASDPLILFTQCSNFTCCGLHLSDLHSLLEHFEETHVVVIDNAGNPVFPPTGASDDFDLSTVNTEPESDYPAYPYTSLVCGYPQLDPQPIHASSQSEPVSPIEVESPAPSAYYPLPTFLEHEHAAHDPDVLAGLDTFSFEYDNSLNSPTRGQPVALPPSSFVTDDSRHRADRPSYDRRHRKSYKSMILGTKLQPYQRRREKAHKCPVRSRLALCFLKIYLTPTFWFCRFADARMFKGKSWPSLRFFSRNVHGPFLPYSHISTPMA